MENTHTKILFKYYSDYLEDNVSETMWAEIIDLEKGHFRLDNIPFFGPLIATDDLFLAEYDETEKRLVFKKTLQSSGNSIVQIVILDKEFDKEIIIEKLKAINCLSEALNDTFLSVEIVRDIDYSIVKGLLSEYEELETIEFAEPCLSDKHRTDLLKN
ncbi:DUF4265 domain-containing protein [Flavobacterium sp. MC2016-06]|uniref:DUF4265 domain-containing protein n=1 Tax=Flavobacterium sp. MC2016-06 TaxID=2676308 RepID=UPI0012BAADEA|nr:DUF4265 domain-containing protein [Flavobacterium sp. MC2016-06]MBU3862381.1 DUF4265 domain-containing protein [Flavobacterium sp. MC2016-06]